jgi:hypothetical protein
MMDREGQDEMVTPTGKMMNALFGKSVKRKSENALDEWKMDIPWLRNTLEEVE